MFTDLNKFFNLKNPLTRTFLFLSLFGLVATADLLIPTSNPAERMDYIIKFILTFVTSAAVFYIVHYGFGLLASNPINFLVSTWIVFLLIHPTNSLWIFPFAIISIALGKLIFRKNKQPIFNPAALAIVLTYLVSQIINLINPASDTLLISWWGADMFQNITSTIPILNILIPLFFFFIFLYCASLFKKIPYILSFFLSFLVSTFIYTFLTVSLETAINFVSISIFNATAFCALVMIPEPKTSPNFPKQQMIVGILAGIALFISNTFFLAFPIDPLINAILVANLLTLLLKTQPSRPQPVASSSISVAQQTTLNTSIN